MHPLSLRHTNILTQTPCPNLRLLSVLEEPLLHPVSEISGSLLAFAPKGGASLFLPDSHPTLARLDRPCGLRLWGPSTAYLLLSDLQCDALGLQAGLQTRVTVQGSFWHLLLWRWGERGSALKELPLAPKSYFNFFLSYLFALLLYDCRFESGRAPPSSAGTRTDSHLVPRLHLLKP